MVQTVNIMAGPASTCIHVLHLTAWSQLGCLARLYIGAVFGDACAHESSTFLPCLTSPGLKQRGGALFIDLPANVFGCFLMGLLSPAGVLSLAYGHQLGIEGNIPVLPQSSPIQGHAAFLVGLRTGLCGTITTYASWLLQMVRMLVGGRPSKYTTEWVASLAGLFIGQAIAMQALTLGQQLVLVIHTFHTKWSRPEAAALPGPQNAAANKQQNDQNAPEPLALPVDRGASDPEAQHHHAKHKQCDLPLSSTTPSTKPPSLPTTAHNRTACLGCACGYLKQPPLFWALDLAALCTALTLTGVSLAYLVLDIRSGILSVGRPMSYVWFSILLAPFGCLLRWQLSRLNAPSLLRDSSWSWLPLGTLLANQAGLIVDIMIAILMVRLGNRTLAQNSALFATEGGFSGALSTVSTWITEVQTLNIVEPRRARGYLYAIITFGISLLIGIVGYGSAVWTL